jgi:hypothetical protein
MKIRILIVTITMLIFILIINQYKNDNKPRVTDCVPATLQRIFPQYSLKQMRKICKTDKEGTTLKDFLNAWDTLSTNELIILFNKENLEYGITNNISFTMYTTYLWIGRGESNGHCALLQFTPTNAIISNSDFIAGTTNYDLQIMSHKTLLNYTFLILDTEELTNKKIRFE